jgi:hypothetical protein
LLANGAYVVDPIFLITRELWHFKEKQAPARYRDEIEAGSDGGGAVESHLQRSVRLLIL